MMNNLKCKVYAMDESNYDELWLICDNISDAQLAIKDWEEQYGDEYMFTLMVEGK